MDIDIKYIQIKAEPVDTVEPEFCEVAEDIKIKTEHDELQNNNKPFKCGICGHRAMTGALLRVHMKNHLVKRLHECSVCKATFFFVTELNRHVLSHTEGRSSYACDICHKDCFTQEALNKHNREHTNEKPLKCRLCDRTFSEDAYLRVHERSHHGEEFFKNNMVRDGTFVDPNVIKIEDDDAFKDFQCKICDKNFLDIEFLKIHIALHENESTEHSIFGEQNFANVLLLSSDIDTEKCRTVIPVEEKETSFFECNFKDDNGKKCLRRFGEKEALELHVNTHDGGDGLNMCELCKKAFHNKQEFYDHMKNNHSSEISDLGENMTRCKQVVKGKEKTVFKCTLCSKCFPVPSKLRSHMRTHTGEKPFKCDVCGKAFGTAGSLKDHTYVHSDEKPFQCKICQKGFTKNSSLEDHIRSHTGEKPYECNICKKKYTTIVILNQHLLAHSKEKPFKCDVCDKSFIYLCNLKYHMVSHTGAKPFACNLCDKTYALKSALKMHTMEHTGDKPHKCQFCDKSFTTVGSLKKHERVHTGEKPYKCTICGRGFTQTSSLSRHTDTHTGEKPYKCTICNKGLTSSSYMKVHMRLHKGQAPYECRFCNTPFAALKKYRAHVREHKNGKERGSSGDETGEDVKHMKDMETEFVNVKTEMV